jgi:NitT/TauT family transport system substrate-binding protein
MNLSRSPALAVCYLKGRSVGVAWLGSSGYLLLGYRGDARRARRNREINWITSRTGNFMELSAEGKVDAFLAFPPDLRELARVRC